MDNDIIAGVKNYYTQKILEYGPTPMGVDWNSRESQYIRFEQLCKLMNPYSPFTLLDYGCGYGELINFLTNSNELKKFKYYGFDISNTMINYAKETFKDNGDVIFFEELPNIKFDYAIASGIFNVKLSLANDDAWLSYILSTLNLFNQLTTKGFSFNVLTKYSDENHMKDYLHYADPLFLFDYCKNHFSRNIALLHDYDLFEFTILVKKNG